jgi:diguanylate cyclase (GGDEF)-like protein
MPTPSRPAWFHSIGVKLLLALAVIQVVFLSAALLDLNAFLDRLFEDAAETRAADLGRLVRSALRQEMIREPVLGVAQVLSDIRRDTTIHRVWIIDKNGRIAHATDASIVGTVIERRDPTCVACHGGASLRREHTWFTLDDRMTPVVRHVETIPNEAECIQCHDAGVRVNGIVLVEESTERFQQALVTVSRRLLGTGVLTFAAVLGGALLAMSLFVVRPVKRLLAGVKRLGTGDLSSRVVVRGRGEIADVTSAFNSMAEDLGRRLDEVRNKSAELRIVYSILERVTKSIHLAELKNVLLETFVDVFDGHEAALVSHLPDGAAVEVLVRRRDVHRLRRKVFASVECLSLPEGYASQEVCSRLRNGPADPVVSSDRRAITLSIGSSTPAALVVLRHVEGFSPTSTNPQLLRVVAHHASVAFDNACLYTLVATDSLTQLLTVRLFNRQLDECIAVSLREQTSLAVIILDLDHFKRVNDMWGHPAGDRVLKAAAASLTASIRAADGAYRYGGEEFTVLLPGADRSTVSRIAERVREQIKQVRVPLETGGEGSVTASVGYAVFPDDGTSAGAIVAAADAALYRAKQEGRDRVCAARVADNKMG